ncbi:MAG TPA: carbohydrate ABC transporter substrate-binding protein [Lactococcus sp.]|nr:ABC transporter substrate-binding protein [Lactococcus raffinolactis]HBZ60669.1 carbohydrate ABC transporter substrate-binding protein [Lactococcus sp.]
MKLKKVVTVGLLAAATLAVFTACGKKDASKSDSGEKTLTVWTFTDELKEIVNDYYLPTHKDLGYKIKVVSIPSDQYETKLDPVINTDKAPDVIALESAFVKKYVDSGQMADLGSMDGIKEASNDTYSYVKEVGTSEDGKLRALAWQAAPGGFFYRASLAEKWLGTGDVAGVQSQVSNYADFLKAAETVKDKSGGTGYMLSSIQDLYKPFFGVRKHGWVENDKLVLDSSLDQLMDISKDFVSQKLTQDTEGQSEAWFAGMNENKVFGYSLPTWGLSYWLKPNATSADKKVTTEGDWRMIQGPTSWFWGGTWAGITEKSTKKEEAADLIKYITTDPTFLKKWTEDKGDFVSSQKVVNEIKDTYEEKFLGGQNHYAAFATMAENINAKILTKYDQTIETLYIDNCLIPYSKGEKDKKKAIQDFKDAVANAYPDIKI